MLKIAALAGTILVLSSSGASAGVWCLVPGGANCCAPSCDYCVRRNWACWAVECDPSPTPCPRRRSKQRQSVIPGAGAHLTMCRGLPFFGSR
jgi:hypothetical protein